MTISWKHIGAHILFWLLYIIIWGIHDTAYAPTFWDTIDGNLIGTVWYAIGVYINIYLLVPYLLLKGKRWTYVGVMIPLVLGVSYALAQTYSLYYRDIHLDTSHFFNTAQGMANTGSDFLVVYGLSTCLYFIREWHIKERKLRELESRTLKTELDLLKRQINPHFLFNALNTIHVLIRKDSEKAGEYLERFSDLLSHQLYDLDSQTIPLKSEIKNLEDYLEIQKIRFGDDVDVNWKVDVHLNGQMIAPMLFMNFVENAFKHGESEGEEPVKIDLSLEIEGDFLNFECINSVVSQYKDNGLGLGLANAKRRLELLYPERHSLEVEKGEKEYKVSLELNLRED